jgi:hypothetical protein
MEICFIIGFLSIVSYIIRNLYEKIPFIFDGIYSFDHRRVKELNNGSIFFTFVLIFCYYFQNKIIIIKKKIEKII